MSAATSAFVRDLVEASPSLRPVLEEHNEHNDGVELPHVFLGDATRALISFYQGGKASREQLDDALEFLERRFRGGDDEIRELIAVSFLENLPRADQPGSGIQGLLGPELAAEKDRLGI